MHSLKSVSFMPKPDPATYAISKKYLNKIWSMQKSSSQDKLKIIKDHSRRNKKQAHYYPGYFTNHVLFLFWEKRLCNDRKCFDR